VLIKRILAAWLLLVVSMTAAFAQDINDAQRVGVLIVASQAEVAAGQLAARRTKSRSMQVFAARIVAESRQVNQEADAMLQRLGASAQRSNVSDTITRQTRNDLSDLDDASEYDFDLAFLDREVTFLAQLVATIDDYIRTTNNADVKVLLVRSRPAFTFHLDQARQLQFALNRPNFER
jgi:putative membrane protein